MGVIKRTDLGIHRLKDTAAYINRNHFCRLNATAARLKSALSGEAWWACMQNRTVRGGHLNWIFLWSSFQCAVIELSNVAVMKSIPRAMTLMNNLPRKYPCSEIKGEMNAASCAVATLFFAHITIYFELNCYPVKCCMCWASLISLARMTKPTHLKNINVAQKSVFWPFFSELFLSIFLQFVLQLCLQTSETF